MTTPIIENSDIPTSFSQSVDRPFEPVGVRTLAGQEQAVGRNNERLTDEQIKELIKNPQIKKSTRLQDLTQTENELRDKDVEEDQIYNLSIKEIGYRTSDTIHNILDDILQYQSKDGIRGILHIFTKSDRLIYIGLIIIFFSIIILLIYKTE